jgi:hypothetical protein
MSKAAGGTSSEEVRQALAYLKLFWGDEFLIGHDEQGYWAAAPSVRQGGLVRAGSPEELGKLMNGEGAGQ